MYPFNRMYHKLHSAVKDSFTYGGKDNKYLCFVLTLSTCSSRSGLSDPPSPLYGFSTKNASEPDEPN